MKRLVFLTPLNIYCCFLVKQNPVLLFQHAELLLFQFMLL